MKVIGRITGTIFLIDGDRPKGEETGGYRINIGLNLKLSKRNLEVSFSSSIVFLLLDAGLYPPCE